MSHLCCRRGVEGETAAPAQLEGVVELVLLGPRLEHHLVPAHHQEAAVAEIGRMQRGALESQNACGRRPLCTSRPAVFVCEVRIG